MKKVIFFGLITLFTSCVNKFTVNDNDVVKKCVIKRFDITSPSSSIEPGYRYNYYTECGEKITVRQTNIYHIGDTVTLIYKK